jgi:hypothetical protein
MEDEEEKRFAGLLVFMMSLLLKASGTGVEWADFINSA